LKRYGESSQHEKAKNRIGAILSAQGWKVYVDCYAFECETAKGPRTYWPDVYATSPEYNETDGPGETALQKRGRRVIVEIQGKGGHNTKLAQGLDLNRLDDIWSCHGYDIECFSFYLGKKKSTLDIRNWSDQDIREELGLT
jgi:hypothetical protein